MVSLYKRWGLHYVLFDTLFNFIRNKLSSTSIGENAVNNQANHRIFYRD